MYRTVLAVVVGIAIVAAFAVPAVAQDEARITVDFDGESLNQVLQMFRRAYGLEYVIGEGVDASMPVTMHLRDVTVEQALRMILPAKGLIAVEQNGRYVIRERAQPQARDPQDREVAPRAAADDRTRPGPTRGVGTYEVGRGAPAANDDNDIEERDEVLEVIWPNHMGAGMAAMMFGGGVVEPFVPGMGMGGMGGMGGTGTTGRGGFGSTGGYGGSSRGGFGSSGGLGGSSRGGFGSSGGLGGSSRGGFGSSGGFDGGSRSGTTSRGYR